MITKSLPSPKIYIGPTSFTQNSEERSCKFSSIYCIYSICSTYNVRTKTSGGLGTFFDIFSCCSKLKLIIFSFLFLGYQLLDSPTLIIHANLNNL